MRYNFLILVCFSLLFASLSISAREISGVSIAESISLPDSTKTLKLNGSGIRSKFFFDIYIGSLYLESTTHKTEVVYALPGEKSIRMHFLYSEVSKEKLTKGWSEGFKNNLSAQSLTQLQPSITLFNSFFSTVKKGDTIHLDFIPDKGTQVIINNEIKGLVSGNDFFPALLSIWLGNDPADTDLKDAMLGNE